MFKLYCNNLKQQLPVIYKRTTELNVQTECLVCHFRSLRTPQIIVLLPVIIVDLFSQTFWLFQTSVNIIFISSHLRHQSKLFKGFFYYFWSLCTTLKVILGHFRSFLVLVTTVLTHSNMDYIFSKHIDKIEQILPFLK